MSDFKYTLDDILKEYKADDYSVKKAQQTPKKPTPASETQRPAVPAEKQKSQNTVRPAAEARTESVQQKAVQPAAAKSETTRTSNDAVQERKTNTAPRSAPSGGYVTASSSKKLKSEQQWFLFKQLVHRDFKSRYKRAVLGVLWSMLSPMLTFISQAIIFSFLFARNQDHFISYLVIGNVVFHFFTDAANQGMFSLVSNGSIISKIKVPKSIFLFSKNVSCLLNFGLTMIIMFIICFVDGVSLSWSYLTLVYPIICLVIFNLGMGYLLSAWFVFFKDTQYLFSLFTQVLMYFSAIFYELSRFPEVFQKAFYANPLFCYITYFRTVIIDNAVPDFKLHLLCAFYAAIVCLLGIAVYKKNSNKFVYYF